MPSVPAHRPLAAVAIAAACAPSLLAYNVAPSPTFLNQALAFALWGAFVAVAAVGMPPVRPGVHRQGVGRSIVPLLAALAVVALAAAGSTWLGALPASLSLSAVGALGAAAVLVVSGAQAGSRQDAEDVFLAFCAGWVVAGLVNTAIAAVQVFAPGLPDGVWIARSSLEGRAVGNLRQPNHLSSLLMWSAIALVALMEAGRLAHRAGTWAFGAILLAIVLTASRTGVVGVGLLACWGASDRRLSRSSRWLLAAAPLVYAGLWLAMSAWSALAGHVFGGRQRMGEGDLSSSRLAIWSDTLALIRAHPWAGVGWGEFNFAWSLTPFPDRPNAFFDHTHNLPLQLAVELGVPLAALVLALLSWALVRAVRRAVRDRGGGSVGPSRPAAAMLVLIGLHSLLEYPLWYAYFLLPAAWVWGFALADARGAESVPVPGSRRAGAPMAAAGAALVVAAAAAFADYVRVTTIFVVGDGTVPLEQRIEAGKRSVLFSHHAHYAAATVAEGPAQAYGSLAVAGHFLLDTRLMLAWAEALDERAQVDHARHVAQRLREFDNPQSEAFFEPCADPGLAPQAFQCQAPARLLTWRDFLAR